jgi:hypothetical protein
MACVTSHVNMARPLAIRPVRALHLTGVSFGGGSPSRRDSLVLSENSIRASSYILVLVDQPTESIVPTYCASMAVTTSAVV